MDVDGNLMFQIAMFVGKGNLKHGTSVMQLFTHDYHDPVSIAVHKM